MANVFAAVWRRCVASSRTFGGLIRRCLLLLAEPGIPSVLQGASSGFLRAYVPRGSCNYAPASRVAAMGVESHNNS